jgi:multidrug resistance efflux pump
MTKWITILLSVCGLGLAGYVVATSGEKVPDAPPAATPTVNPYADGIAAAGTVEAVTRNLTISAPVGGLVVEVLAGVNDRVETGAALFRLDDRELKAGLPRQEADLAQASAELERLRASPRPEDLPPLRAAVEVAQSRFADAEDWYNNLRQAREDEAATDKELRRAWFALETARGQLQVARAELARAEAGPWEKDIVVADARVAAARAAVGSTRSLIERLTVRAPVGGVVLKRNVEPGRFATTDPNDPAMVLGAIDELHVRAQVDEEDLPRLREGAGGTARVRGAAEKRLPLAMVRIEPLALPKRSLTGDISERVDTRIVEVVFRVSSTEGMRLYPGQVVDVYIDASTAGAAR